MLSLHYYNDENSTNNIDYCLIRKSDSHLKVVNVTIEPVLVYSEPRLAIGFFL